MLSGGLFFQSEIVAGPLGTDSYRITVVPEPAAAGLALLSLTMLLIDCRRRRREPQSAANEGSASSTLPHRKKVGDMPRYRATNNIGTIGLAGDAQLTLFGDLIQNGMHNIRSDSAAVIFGDFSGSGGTNGDGTLEVLGNFISGQ